MPLSSVNSASSSGETADLQEANFSEITQAVPAWGTNSVPGTRWVLGSLTLSGWRHLEQPGRRQLQECKGSTCRSRPAAGPAPRALVFIGTGQRAWDGGGGGASFLSLMGICSVTAQPRGQPTWFGTPCGPSWKGCPWWWQLMEPWWQIQSSRVCRGQARPGQQRIRGADSHCVFACLNPVQQLPFQLFVSRYI